ncbi:DNA cytosine methyltransferase [Pseudidiomarina aquimaris]|uniref:DNA cytosine methyltransferase n=1 Tax=Pseudidiomarina aquimaris TaxID=641841 RepID=UPI003A97AA92
MTKYKYLDLFSGCGGLSHGFYRKDGFECLLASDFWEKAEFTYTLNHPDTPFELKDFSKTDDIKAVIDRFENQCDIVMGGPPCQGFSTLGKRRLDCDKSILVDSFIDIATKISPKLIIMENVKTITSKKHPAGGLVISKVYESLERAGYFYKTLILKATDFGLGQTRQRFFLFAVKEADSQILDEVVGNIEKSKKNKFSLLKDLIGDLPPVPAGGGAQIMEFGGRTIYNHQAMNHSEKLLERFRHVPVDGGLLDVPKELLTNHLRKMVEGKYGTGGHTKNIYGRMNWEKPSGTIVAGMDKITVGRFLHPDEDRLLTPRECARIQSFPDDFVFKGSLVNQYYLIGNAVPPVFSEVIASSVLSALKE